MSATNSTTHYNLPSFLGSDKPAWLVDWNGAMATIDSAIYEAKQAADTARTSAAAVASDLATLSDTVSTQGSTISTLSDTLTTAVGNINTINGNINTINSLIGNGTPTTTDQTIIGAINEINANVGDPADASGVTGSDAFEKIAALNTSLSDLSSVTEINVTGATMQSTVAQTLSKFGVLTSIDCSFTPNSTISAGTPLFTISENYMARLNSLKTFPIYVLDNTSAFVIGVVNQNDGTVYSDTALNAGVLYKINTTLCNNLA